MRPVVWMALTVVGCGQVRPGGSWPGRGEPVPEPIPGQVHLPAEWRSNPDSGDPVQVSLVTSGLMTGSSVLANGMGDRVVFSLSGMVCEVDAEDGSMPTDDAVAGTGLEIEDTDQTKSLSLTSLGLFELTPDEPGGAIVEQLRVGRFSAGRYVGEAVVAISTDCEVQWADGGRLFALPEGTCDALDLAATDAELVVASPDGTLVVDADGVTAVDPAEAEYVAALDGELFASSAGRVRALTAGWEFDAGEGTQIVDLVEGGGLGLLLVDLVDDEGLHRVEVLDAPTGAWLGTFDLRTAMSDIDVSDAGGLLLQVRGEDVVSWRITR